MADKTPLEERASELAINLALHAAMFKLVEDDAEIELAKDALDWQNDDDDRALMIEAMKDAKAINEAFLITGTILEVEHGISA